MPTQSRRKIRRESIAPRQSYTPATHTSPKSTINTTTLHPKPAVATTRETWFLKEAWPDMLREDKLGQFTRKESQGSTNLLSSCPFKDIIRVRMRTICTDKA